MGIEIVIAAITILASIIGAFVYLAKVVVPKFMTKADERTDATLNYFQEELKAEREERKQERKEFVTAVAQITEVASNHLTDFSHEICEDLKKLEAKNGLRDDLLMKMSDIVIGLSGSCPYLKTKEE